ncbi:MAG: hypothetical protein U0X75_13020 [Acidobacteriota bacterium]
MNKEHHIQSQFYAPVQIGAFELSATPLLAMGKIVYLARLESGHAPRKALKITEKTGMSLGFACRIFVKHIWKSYSEDKIHKATKLGIDNSSARVLPAGTVCFSRDISVGYTTIMGCEMATTQHFG